MHQQTITPAAETVLELTDVKLFLRVDISADDDIITRMMRAAEKKCQDYIRRPLLPTVMGLWFDLGEVFDRMTPKRDRGFISNHPSNWPTHPVSSEGSIDLPKGNCTAVTKIASYNEANEETIIPTENYFVDTTSDQGGRVHFYTLNDGTRPVNSLLIQFTAGYADVDSIPETLIHGMNMLISHWYENREAYENGTVPKSVKSIWNSERIWKI